MSPLQARVAAQLDMPPPQKQQLSICGPREERIAASRGDAVPPACCVLPHWGGQGCVSMSSLWLHHYGIPHHHAALLPSRRYGPSSHQRGTTQHAAGITSRPLIPCRSPLSAEADVLGGVSFPPTTLPNTTTVGPGGRLFRFGRQLSSRRGINLEAFHCRWICSGHLGKHTLLLGIIYAASKATPPPPPLHSLPRRAAQQHGATWGWH